MNKDDLKNSMAGSGLAYESMEFNPKNYINYDEFQQEDSFLKYESDPTLI